MSKRYNVNCAELLQVKVVLNERGVKTNIEELFLLINNKELKYVNFSCISNLKALALSK